MRTKWLLSAYPIKLRNFVCDQNGRSEQFCDERLEIFKWSTVVNPVLVQNQIYEEQRILP